MAEQKLTPTQKLKLAEAEITNLKKLVFQLKEDQAKHLNDELFRVQEQQYKLGYDEGYAEATKLAAAQRADAGIARFFRK
jgi:hypothetical protein